SQTSISQFALNRIQRTLITTAAIHGYPLASFVGRSMILHERSSLIQTLLTPLAAAHAEQGDFRSAIAVLHKSLSCATEDGDQEHARFCLELSGAGEPWRLESPSWCRRWA